MTKTLVDPILFSREFGSQALRVHTLQAWAEKRGLTIPPTVPSVADFDMVALESLLVAIERGVPTMQDDAVLDIAKAIPCDAVMGKLIEKGVVQSARWLVGANIHQQWRGVLATAIANGELGTVDALTGLPMASPTELAHPTLAAVTQKGIGPAISTDNLCDAFDKVKFTSLQWQQKIDNGPPQWLLDCRASTGNGGNVPKKATWWPVNVALALLAGMPRGKAATKREIDTAFNVRPELASCKKAWFDYCADHPHIG